MSNQEKATAISIIEKIRKAGGDEALKAFLDSKGEDMPALKLTSKEMELLKGGANSVGAQVIPIIIQTHLFGGLPSPHKVR